MARIGFLGLGNMGMPMAQNLLKAGHAVAGFDVVPASLAKLNAAGGTAAASVAQASAGAHVVITLRQGVHVPAVSSAGARPAGFSSLPQPSMSIPPVGFRRPPRRGASPCSTP